MFKGVLIIIVEDYKKENLEMIFNVCFKKMFWLNFVVEVIIK